VRPRLLTTMADEGKDPQVQAFGDSVARVYLDDPARVEPGLGPPALSIAAMRGDAALRDRIRQKFETTDQPAERRTFMTALVNFRDPALVDANLDYALKGPLKPQEVGFFVSFMNFHAPNREKTWPFVQKNYATLLARIPPMYGAFMPVYAGGCSAERLEEGKKFFADPDHQPPGYAKELARIAEGVGNCLDLREREGARVKAYLTRAAADGQIP